MTSKDISEPRQGLICLAVLICGSTLAARAAPAVQPAGDQAVDICEVARHAERYQNRVLTISGFYFHGRHGATIANEHCGFRNRYRLFRRGAAAAAKFDVSEAQPIDNANVVDNGSIRKFYDAVAKADGDAGLENPVILVTVVGQVNVAKNFSIKSLGDKGEMGTGYGFMGVKSFTITMPKASRHGLP
jgi:hypothetical protein